MIHEQTVHIRSSFLQQSSTFQRDFDRAYIMRCIFDRRLNETLSVFVTGRANETTGTFTCFNFKSSKSLQLSLIMSLDYVNIEGAFFKDTKISSFGGFG